MPLDPHAQALLTAMAAYPPLDFSRIQAADLRAMMAGGSAAFAPGDEVARIEERCIDGPGGPLRLRLYYPEGRGPWPLTVFFHGGGFVMCGLDSHDNLCRCLAARAGCLLVSVDYRLAPEAPFPAAVDDALAAFDWLRAHAAELDADPARLSVAGDSAGGNLAAVTAQYAHRQGHALCHQLLLYPITDFAAESASYRLFAENHYLTAAMLRWFRAQYLGAGADGADPRISPLRAKDFSGLAPATVFTAEYDPLRDEGEAYAQALQAAGVAVALQRVPGQIHGFISMLGVIPAANAALDHAGAVLRRALATRPI